MEEEQKKVEEEAASTVAKQTTESARVITQKRKTTVKKCITKRKGKKSPHKTEKEVKTKVTETLRCEKQGSRACRPSEPEVQFLGHNLNRKQVSLDEILRRRGWESWDVPYLERKIVRKKCPMCGMIAERDRIPSRRVQCLNCNTIL